MIKIKVSDKDKLFAKNQIAEFEKIKEGQWRYKNVEAWGGIVCEMVTAKWLEDNYEVKETAKGLDTSGKIDDFDLIVNNYKVEVKSATKNYFKYIMPKIYDVQNKPKDVYVGAKYNETVEPNEVQIIGYMTRKEILTYPISKNKGAAYYEVPIKDLKKFKYDK